MWVMGESIIENCRRWILRKLWIGQSKLLFSRIEQLTFKGIMV